MELYHIEKGKNSIVVYDELPFDRNEYFTCEYNRIKKRMTQIGISVKGASRVIVKQFDNEVARLTFDNRSNIWYHEQKQWFADNFTQTTDSIFGINAGGSFEILAIDENNKQFDKEKVNITPGTISIEEYKQMQQEVRRLFELFSYDLSREGFNDEDLLKRFQLPLYPQSHLKRLIEQFIDCFYEIAVMPKQELIHSEKKINLHQLKKWTPSIIIENAIKQNGKVRATVSEKTTEIKENQMIRFMVEEFQQRTNMELVAERNQLKSLQNELVQLEEVEKKEQSYLTNYFSKLKEVINADCEKLEIRINNWLNMKKIIEELLTQSLLQGNSIILEETHLFRMHPYYSELYNIYTEYENLSPVLSDTFRLFIQSILKSPTLYEIWVLLKIVEYLSQWGVNPHEFNNDIQELYLSRKSISGYKKKFSLEDKPFDICIYYDYTIDEIGYRPDFIIGFFNKENNKWLMHTLDAKYKCYSKMKNGDEKILYDLERSGTRYLNELFHNAPNITLKSATLVHSDINSMNWNVKHLDVNPDRKQHRIAHFYLTPLHNKNISIYFKRLLHECSNLESCCSKCGKDVEGVKEEKEPYKDKLRWKTTYICEECDEVWVANFCSTCSYNNRGMRRISRSGNIYRYPRPLFKYPIDNYNLQVEENWDVHCPTCNKTANHWINFKIQENLLKGTTIQNK